VKRALGTIEHDLDWRETVDHEKSQELKLPGIRPLLIL
jgi:hypothetical protein